MVIAEGVEHFDLRYLVTVHPRAPVVRRRDRPERRCGCLYVVDKPDNLRTEETMRIFLMESWGYTVDPIDDDAEQEEFDAAFALHDVVYVSPSAGDNQVGSALVAAPIGLVNENGNACETLDLAEQCAETDASFAGLIITDNSHYITRPFVTGLVPLLTIDDQLIHFDRVETPLAAGATALGSPSRRRR